MMNYLPIICDPNWDWVSRGNGSTNPSFNDDNALQLGKHTTHTYKTPLQKNKTYTVYFYNPKPTDNVQIGYGTSNGEVYSDKPTDKSNGVHSGHNTATLYNDNKEWKLQYNNDTVHNITNKKEVYLTITTENDNESTETQIIAITEEKKEKIIEE